MTMKNLLYKEFKLVVHPVCLLFVILFPLLALIPNYPKFISLIYVYTCYPIIFMGVNKGVNNNDIFYSLTLPAKRKQLVLSRIITLAVLQFICIAFTTVFFYIGTYIETFIPKEEIIAIGFKNDAFFNMLGFGILSFGILDIIFLPIFYRTARNIGWAMTIGGLIFSLSIFAFCLGIPYIPFLSDIFNSSNILVNILTPIVCLIIYIILHYFSYKISYKLFKKVDF